MGSSPTWVVATWATFKLDVPQIQAWFVQSNNDKLLTAVGVFCVHHSGLPVHVPFQAEITQSTTVCKRPSGLRGKGHFLLLHWTYDEGFAYESREADSMFPLVSMFPPDCMFPFRLKLHKALCASGPVA